MLQLHSPPRRQGVILLIVVIMLALFLVVGIAFMLFAESEATTSRIYREAFTINYDRADIEPADLLQWALGQLIYDVSDYGDGVYSAMRGHSLARNMYGWNYYTKQTPDGLGFSNATNYSHTQNLSGAPPYLDSPIKNTNAFNGFGKISDSAIDPPPFSIPNLKNYELMNYTFFPSDGFLRDPERI